MLIISPRFMLAAALLFLPGRCGDAPGEAFPPEASAQVVQGSLSNVVPVRCPEREWSEWTLLLGTVLEGGVDIRCKRGTFKYGEPPHTFMHSWNVRNRSGSEVRFTLFYETVDEKGVRKTGSDRYHLKPNQEYTFAGQHTYGRSVQFRVRRDDAPARRPTAGGLVLPAECVRLLKQHAERQKIAGEARTILAWTPIALIASDLRPAQLGTSIGSMPWEELARSFSNVNRLLYSSLATEARNHAESHDGELRRFWIRLSEAYASKL
jgi:hypothetical protein